MNALKKVAVFSSTNGGTFQKIIEHSLSERRFEVIGLITDRNCKATEIAANYEIPLIRITKELSKTDFNKIQSLAADLFVLAGYLSTIPSEVCEALSGKMINVHPSLLPKYGGRGMYGMKVHEAVIAKKEEYSGCTVHFVSQDIDQGQIIAQKKLKILDNESPIELGKRIWELEGKTLIRAIDNVLAERIEE